MSNRPRQSVYPQPPSTTYWSILDSCAQSLHATSSSLNSAATTLHQGTADFPRLTTLFRSRRCFEVVTETEVAAAQRDLVGEIEPQIKELIERAEGGLSGLSQRERGLRAKVDKRSAPPPRNPAPKVDMKALERKLKLLRARKEELGRTAERLEKEAGRA